jgi:hypothetical protein
MAFRNPQENDERRQRYVQGGHDYSEMILNRKNTPHTITE